ncbi:unnamed protein product [Adineta steineri]|uniref:Uncharacterized protein n=1 Tax=Adineta steineri TaxID=433720 RepID=A0A819RT55_9BILA|nr:unnamed protein product [Adineta steineri]CAF4053015.1 unnamed protein product [Adineta steineri]
MSTMNNNNRIGVVDDAETVASNGTQPETLCEYLKRRKVMWITFTITVLVIITMIPIIILQRTKTNSESISTTQKMDVTSGS